MSIITSLPTPNLWDSICQELDRERNPVKEGVKTDTECVENYNPAVHNPVFFSDQETMCYKVSVDDNPMEDVDPAITHPAVVGYSFVQKPPPTPEPSPPPPPDSKKCPPLEYLQYYIFPHLLPALTKMMEAAKEENCFIWKRTKFNACDFLTEYLYNNNPHHPDRDEKNLGEIPFVAAAWAVNPRPPLPKSLVWTAPEAALVLQSFWRGFKVRCEDEVQELRQWQKEWREENANVQDKVNQFWSERLKGEAGDDENEQEEEEEEEK